MPIPSFLYIMVTWAGKKSLHLKASSTVFPMSPVEQGVLDDSSIVLSAEEEALKYFSV